VSSPSAHTAGATAQTLSVPQVRIYKSPEPQPPDLFELLERTTRERYQDQRVDPHTLRASKAYAALTDGSRFVRRAR